MFSFISPVAVARAPRLSVSLAATALAVLTALGVCAPVAAQTAASPARSPLIPNTRKYSDKGLHPATGRTGSATVTVRALRGADGTTDLEVTTGTLDDTAPAPGSVSKVQAKVFDKDDTLRYARVFNGLSGAYFKTVLDDLPRGTPLQVQSSVRDIDGSRTDVVTLIEPVKLRPDLRVHDLVAPARAAIYAPVNVVASVTESNADVGAAARCVLYVDDVAADSAEGIWVDAEDTVSCAFTRVFSTSGPRRITVSVEGVTPGDFDPSNNSASGVIEIGDPVEPLNYTAQVVDGTRHERGRYEDYWRRNTGLYGLNSDFSFAYEIKRRDQYVLINAWTRSEVSFPVDLAASEISDGSVVKVLSFGGLVPDATFDYGNYRYTLVKREDPATGTYLSFATWHQVGGPALPLRTSELVYGRNAGTVTYHSSQHTRFWDNITGETVNYYSENIDRVTETGSFTPFGAEYGLRVSFGSSGGQTTFIAAPAMTLRPSASSNTKPWSCREIVFSDQTNRHCDEFFNSEEVKSAFALQLGYP